MSSGSSSPVVTQSQSKDPWSGVSPFLSSMYGTAESMRQSGTGYQPWAYGTQADIDPYLAYALGQQQSIAGSQLAGNTPVVPATDLATTVMKAQGITPGIANAISGLTQTTGNWTDVINQAKTAQNPYLQSLIDVQNRRIADQIGSRFSGAGRYGSGMMQDVTARALSESALPMLQSDYEARQQRMMNAIQQLGNTYNTMGDIYGRGLQQAGQYAQLAPGLAQAAYDPAQQATAVGQFYTARTQQALNDAINLYNAQQAYPWQSLEREAAILAGAGQLGGTTVSNQTTQVPLTQRLLGGALAGGAIGSTFGPIGTGVGALGGGLLGLV